ncbi:lipoxygenase homology domain-containing protein 1-like [Babylonia areolata]|uniref:lipoxygenase homology domain-containing protein 1-like n=1 Tax=Babylonia areolata TaxID=304850 RepID=UPI003FD4F0B7
MSANNVWHRPPTQASSGSSRPLRAVRYTWAGPFNTQLYDDQLTDLTDRTRDNLSRLANNMMQDELCDQYGIKHYHPASSSQASKTGRPQERPPSRGSWSNLSVMFTSAGSLGASQRPADDASSITSTFSGPMNFCYLCSTMEEHQRNHLKLRTPVPLNKDGSVRQKKQRIQYIPPPPRPKKKEEEPVVVQEALYKVTVWTGDVPSAGTDANVFITIVGDRDILNKTKLWRRQGTSNFCFVRGSKEVFHLKGPKLGNLSVITLEHDGLEKRHGWYVDRVEVQCMQTQKTWVFVCKNWLSMHHGDFRIKRDLEATERQLVIRDFEVTVETGKKRLAGTDANVYITVNGSLGRSRKHHLNALNRGTCFQRGQTNKFKIHMPDIGAVRSIRIEHDGEGMASGWFLNKIMLQDVQQPQLIYHFLYNGWIAKDVGDGTLWREIRAKKRLPREITSGKPVQYEVIVKTGDVRYAGTDANVYIIFMGSSGKSTKMFMDDSSNNFERGMTESFKLKAMDVGHLTSIVIGHDNSGPGAGWFCEFVKVRKHLTRQEITAQLTEQKQAWKSSRRQQHQRLATKLSQDKENVSDAEDDEEDADPGKRSGKTKRDERFADVFDRDGRVLKVPVYEEYFFPCAKWFAADEGDGLLERELQFERQTLFFQER